MAMRVLVHKVALGLAPPQLASLLPVRGVVSEPMQRQMLGHWKPLRNRQISTPANFRSSAVMKRAVFGIDLCYSKLPQRLIDYKSVKMFQSALQQGLLRFAELRVAQGCDWERLYLMDWRRLQRTHLDELFV